VLTSKDVQRCSSFRARLSEHKRTIGKVKSSESIATPEVRMGCPPVKPARYHQVKDKPEIAFKSNGDTFADAPKSTYNTAFDVRKRWLRGSEQKGARKAHFQERLANDSRLQRADISGYVRQFGHQYQLACYSSTLQLRLLMTQHKPTRN
jgi:hypothetical protein